ncbi:tRNA (adenosine(37)-N6)-dimethylallyltransferase MiaA, partial [Amylibacter sp.]|nr:tRNA (adenosine(37)-N6)-dimethylallyltransferase MiaA [Amylibacter sp.]
MEQIFKGNKPILIAGATATGKSAFGIELAQKYNGIIINADSLQIYKQWKILTARPDNSEIRECPHSLYGHINLGKKYSSGHWLRDVRQELI